MDLVRDMLDKQLVDRKERRLGKVDGIVLSLAPGEPPKVAALEVGPLVLARRLSPRAERWTAALISRLGAPRDAHCRIPWSKVRDIGLDVEVDVPIEETMLHVWQRWLRRVFIGRIPGG
jgi:sporulation protein YlmC with PRC-barrel domain